MIGEKDLEAAWKEALDFWEAGISLRPPVEYVGQPESRWKADDPLHTLKPRTTYSMYGLTTDNSSSAESVQFTVEQLAAMEPGQVRTDAGVTSEDEFRKGTCARFGS